MATTAASTMATTPTGIPAVNRIEIPQHLAPAPYPPMQSPSYPQHLSQVPPQAYHNLPAGYTNYASSNLPETSLPSRLAASQPLGPGIKRGPPTQPHPGETPPKKKQSKWTTDEDREIIELRGRGMKWEDISKRLPGRSAISCRLRFQNYLERRSEWDEEKKNKLARLYERFKKDMWEKISKEMQLPWRAAEAMHWQIGEIEMAQRANVPVFHLAGQQGPTLSQPGVSSDGGTSTSPTSATGSVAHGTMPYTHSHNHSLPQLPPSAVGHPLSPVGHFRRGSIDSASPNGMSMNFHRRRADSMRSVESTHSRGQLPSLDELTGIPSRDGRAKYPPGPW